MEKFTLKVCTFADTEDQEVILDATGHCGDEVEAYEKGRELARAMLVIGGGFAAQIDVKKGEYPFMRQLTVMLYPADADGPEEEMVLTDIRPKEEWR